MLKFTSSVVSSSSRASFSSCHVRLSGHNKWSKIQQKKGVNDARKGIIFGKAAKDIIVAVRVGGSADPTKNLQLATVLKRTRELGVPKENVEKALTKASKGTQDGSNFTYEALAFESIGIIIECQTDNNNRTIHSLREILNKYGGRATPVKFMFERQGYIAVTPKEDLVYEVEDLASHALDNGATDFDESRPTDGGLPTIHFVCEPGNIHTLAQSLEDKNPSWRITATEVRYVPTETDTKVSEETKSALRELMDELGANEDVVQVATSISNFS